MKCKYNISYRVSSQEEADKILPELKKLGYRTEEWSWKYNNGKDPYIIVDNVVSSDKVGRALLNSIVDDTVKLEDKDAFLAIAAQREDDKFHEGEWVVITGEGHSRNNEHFPKGELFRIFEITDETDCYIDRSSNKKVTGVCTNAVRKATIEEIIQHFNKQKQQTSMKQDFSVGGNSNLMEAFKKELEDNGITKSECFSKNICPSKIKKNAYSGKGNKADLHYTLPQDWDKALEAFKNYWKETPEEMAKRAGLTIGMKRIFQGRPYYHKDGNGEKSPSKFSDNPNYAITGFTEHKGENCVLVTWQDDTSSYKIPIQDFIDNPIPKEKTIKVKYQEGELEFVVGKSKFQIVGEKSLSHHTEIMRQFGQFEDLLEVCENKTLFGYDVNCNTIDIGCKKNVSIFDLQEVIKVYKEFNN